VPCRALVVDDDPANRKVLRSVLEKEAWIVAEAEDGRAALAEQRRQWAAVTRALGDVWRGPGRLSTALGEA
jgi:CheY-like chemotaxis protein